MKLWVKASTALGPITAADAAEDALKETMDTLNDDFDYILSGIENLNRAGGDSAKNAMSIASELSVTLNDYINRIAASTVGGGE